MTACSAFAVITFLLIEKVCFTIIPVLDGCVAVTGDSRVRGQCSRNVVGVGAQKPIYIRECTFIYIK